jgi:hypothetical protein
MSTIVERPSDGIEQARDALFPETVTPPVDRHWFVDLGGYCAACNLPESNTARHSPRVTAR